jgi:hypothetical protein
MCKKELVYAAKLGKTIIFFMLEKMNQAEIGDEIGFILGNCVYKQFYKNPKSKEPKKDVRHVDWYIDYFDEAYELIKSNLDVNLAVFSFSKIIRVKCQFIRTQGGGGDLKPSFDSPISATDLAYHDLIIEIFTRFYFF